MNKPEAIRVIAALASYFPAREMPSETATLWAGGIDKYELTDALEAVETMGTMGRFMPSLAEFVEAIRDCQRHRLEKRNVRSLAEEGQGSGPFLSMTEWLADEAMTDARMMHRARREFPSLIAQIRAKAMAAPMPIADAHHRLERLDYHADERIQAARVVVTERMRLGNVVPSAASTGEPVFE